MSRRVPLALLVGQAARADESVPLPAPAPIHFLAFGAATLTCAHEGGAVRTWDRRTGRCTGLLRRVPVVDFVALHSEGTFVASEGFGAVWVWRVATGELCLRVAVRPTDRHSWALAGHTLALATGASAERRLLVWDLDGGALRVDRPLEVWESALALDRGGDHIASAGLDEAQWRVTVRSLRGAPDVEESADADRPDDVRSLAFSPSGRVLGFGTAGSTVARWDLDSGALALHQGHADDLRVAVSDDGRAAAAGAHASTIWLHDTAAAQTRVLSGHYRYARDVAFSPDGRWLASGARDGAVCVWDAQTGGREVTLQVLPDGGTLAFTPRGDWVGTPRAERWIAAGTGTPASAVPIGRVPPRPQPVAPPVLEPEPLPDWLAPLWESGVVRERVTAPIWVPTHHSPGMPGLLTALDDWLRLQDRLGWARLRVTEGNGRDDGIREFVIEWQALTRGDTPFGREIWNVGSRAVRVGERVLENAADAVSALSDPRRAVRLVRARETNLAVDVAPEVLAYEWGSLEIGAEVRAALMARIGDPEYLRAEGEIPPGLRWRSPESPKALWFAGMAVEFVFDSPVGRRVPFGLRCLAERWPGWRSLSAALRAWP